MLDAFREIVVADFEFAVTPGNRPTPVCLVAHELHSERWFRIWQDEFGSSPPYATGPDVLFIAFYASAELGCYRVLGWPMPERILDLFCEFRARTNGLNTPAGNSLLGALAYFSLDSIGATEKKELQEAIGNGTWRGRYTPQEILDYCMTDCVALAAMLPKMLPLNLLFALLRGRYGAAVARMERAGIPIDLPLYRRVVSNWEELKRDLISDVDQSWGVYENGHFRTARFEHRLSALGILRGWPRTETGLLALDDDTFLEQTALHPELPQLQTLRELRATLGRMRLIWLEIGEDGRNRCSLMPSRR